MKVALIGYGKMGKAVEKAAIERGWTISTKIHPSSQTSPHIAPGVYADVLATDVFIDFSSPEAVLHNAEQIAAFKKPLVIGTTGWDAHIPQVKKMADRYGVGIVYGQNFSLGVNLFVKMAAYAVELIDQYDDFDFSISEMHHREKKDSPSGTALFLANQLLSKSTRKNGMCNEKTTDPNQLQNQLQISSLRCGYSPGVHTLTIDSSCDTIALSHTSKNRDAFAKGALFAAEWIQGKQGMYHFSEML